jgi:hypothetical protein
MKVELLHDEGCPGARPARALLEAVLEQLAPGTRVSDVVVATEEQTRELGFQGSPSIRVNGRDLEGKQPESSGLT